MYYTYTIMIFITFHQSNTKVLNQISKYKKTIVNKVETVIYQKTMMTIRMLKLSLKSEVVELISDSIMTLLIHDLYIRFGVFLMINTSKL